MAADDDIDGVAGEYVLGTLDLSERNDVEARIPREPALAAAVGGWAGRLQPLADLAGEEAPPASLWSSILDRIRSTGETGRVVLLERSVRVWRYATAGIGIAAAVLAVMVISDRMVPPPAGPSFVAVLNGEGGQPAFVAAVDTLGGTIKLRRIGGAPPPDKSFELWQVPVSGPTVSMGVADSISALKALNVSLKPGEKLAVSLEPKGGSPTGKTTGPVLYIGDLLPTE